MFLDIIKFTLSCFYNLTFHKVFEYLQSEASFIEYWRRYYQCGDRQRFRNCVGPACPCNCLLDPAHLFTCTWTLAHLEQRTHHDWKRTNIPLSLFGTSCCVLDSITQSIPNVRNNKIQLNLFCNPKLIDLDLLSTGCFPCLWILSSLRHDCRIKIWNNMKLHKRRKCFQTLRVKTWHACDCWGSKKKWTTVSQPQERYHMRPLDGELADCETNCKIIELTSRVSMVVSVDRLYLSWTEHRGRQHDCTWWSSISPSRYGQRTNPCVDMWKLSPYLLTKTLFGMSVSICFVWGFGRNLHTDMVAWGTRAHQTFLLERHLVLAMV